MAGHLHKMLCKVSTLYKAILYYKLILMSREKCEIKWYIQDKKRKKFEKQGVNF